jgi:succinate-semialdehyde dehydrogenase/glutarate-semialdehyde dehydrogenase
MPATAAATLQSYNPATGELVGEVPATPIDEVPAIVARARAAAPAWAALTAQQRADVLRPAADVLESRADDLGLLLTREMGKPLAEAIGEVKGVAASLRTKLDEIVNAVAPVTLDDDATHSTLHYDPYGVCACITPWNFPIAMPHSLVIPALVTGNTAILKPSEETPLIAQAYADILNQLLPKSVLQVVHGADDQGKALVDADVDLIAFTGSRDVGRTILAAAAASLKRVILELGSKDPLIVMEGADVPAAAAFAARNSFRNAGQVCVSTERIYVDKRIAKPFLDALVKETLTYTVGDGLHESTRVGPMIGAWQKQHVLDQIDDAVQRGAEVVHAGTPRDGNYLEPTILANLTHDMRIMTEETFGPVACVMTVDSEDEAVALANDTEYGLGAVVFADTDKARALARRLTAGMIGINKHVGGAAGSPWVGARQSGYAYHAGKDGHRQFCQLRVVSEPK